MSRSYHDGPDLEHFTGIFGDLVNEDALGVDVLGPCLAEQKHLLLRKSGFQLCERKIVCRMLNFGFFSL